MKVSDIQTLQQLGGTVFTVVAFLYFIWVIIKLYVESQKIVSASQNELAKQLQSFSDAILGLTKSNENLVNSNRKLELIIADQSRIIKSLYRQRVKEKLDEELFKDGHANKEKVKMYTKALSVSEK